MARLTDAQLRAWRRSPPVKTQPAVPDGSVPGLALRRGPHSMTWSLQLRVKGRGACPGADGTSMASSLSGDLGRIPRPYP
jgi:hypothetical protein